MAAHQGARGPWALLAVLTSARVACGMQFQSGPVTAKLCELAIGKMGQAG